MLLLDQRFGIHDHDLFLVNWRLTGSFPSTGQSTGPQPRGEGGDTWGISRTLTIVRYVFIGRFLVSHGLVKICWKQAPSEKIKGAMLLTAGNDLLVYNCAWIKKICRAQCTATCVWTYQNEPSHILWFPTSQRPIVKWKLDAVLLRRKCSVMMMRIIMLE